MRKLRRVITFRVRECSQPAWGSFLWYKELLVLEKANNTGLIESLRVAALV